MAKPPGILWIAVLGGAGFAAGFFGPMVFIPDSNLGPMVGIFLTGPGGCALGLVMYLAMKALPLSVQRQWFLLLALAATGTLATLIFVQPEPATRGYEVELSVVRTLPPAAVADEVIADWQQRIAKVTWAAPRPGWEPQMREALAADRGVVIEAVLLRQRTLKEHRKPWHKGVFAMPWQNLQEKKRYYLPPGVTIPPGPGRLFIHADSSERIRPPESWPPLKSEEFIGFSCLEPIPSRFVTPP